MTAQQGLPAWVTSLLQSHCRPAQAWVGAWSLLGLGGDAQGMSGARPPAQHIRQLQARVRSLQQNRHSVC